MWVVRQRGMREFVDDSEHSMPDVLTRVWHYPSTQSTTCKKALDWMVGNNGELPRTNLSDLKYKYDSSLFIRSCRSNVLYSVVGYFRAEPPVLFATTKFSERFERLLTAPVILLYHGRRTSTPLLDTGGFMWWSAWKGSQVYYKTFGRPALVHMRSEVLQATQSS